MKMAFLLTIDIDSTASLSRYQIYRYRIFSLLFRYGVAIFNKYDAIKYKEEKTCQFKSAV